MTYSEWLKKVKNNRQHINNLHIIDINRTSEEAYEMYNGTQKDNAGVCSDDNYRSAINGEEGKIKNIFVWLHCIDGIYLPVSATVLQGLLDQGTCQLNIKIYNN